MTGTSSGDGWQSAESPDLVAPPRVTAPLLLLRSQRKAEEWRLCGGNPAGEVHKVFVFFSLQILDKVIKVLVERGLWRTFY